MKTGMHHQIGQGEKSGHNDGVWGVAKSICQKADQQLPADFHHQGFK